jgi:hypothetical protein
VKALLMYKDRDFDPSIQLPLNSEELIKDLELNTLLNAMSAGDEFLLKVARSALLSSLDDLEQIKYRQDILKDCLKNSLVIRDIYSIAGEAIEKQNKHFWRFQSRYPGTILHESVRTMQVFLVALKRLRELADKHVADFESEGFGIFFKMLQTELTDEYFLKVQNHLNRLEFPGGVLVSAELGKGDKGTNYILHKLQGQNWDLTRWLISLLQMVLPKGISLGAPPPPQVYFLNPRDIAGAEALEILRNRGINLVANALVQSTDYLLNFFNMLRTELAFYIGCLNLSERLVKIGEPLSFPTPMLSHERHFSCVDLYDISLALNLSRKVVGNEVNADNRGVLIITGANQGGKSTFLRSVGLTQLMMQCGMFVPAKAFRANLCEGIFTHYKREEDRGMERGKLDEELSRMSTIVDNIRPNALILFNESFAATNEREGAEIAMQITSALLERDIKVFFVTHQFEFAHAFYKKRSNDAFFLRAERKADGSRTFKLLEGEPLQTSFGEDLYHKIFSLI